METDHIDGDLLITFDGNTRVGDEWILDSSCMFHVTPNRDWFATYELVPKDTMVMGNNASCMITGTGIVQIKMFDGVIRTLGDVMHVLDVKKSLISLCTLDSKGTSTLVKVESWRLAKGDSMLYMVL